MSATLGPNQTNISPGVPFFAPAGSGGGGGSANQSFSTISFPVSNQTTEGVVNYAGNLSFNDSTTAVKNTIGFHNGNNYPGMPADVTAIQLAAPVGNQAVTVIGAADDGSSYISATNTGSTPAPLVLSGSGVSISSLTVSSINGAAPGGGGTVGTDLSLSTISFPIGNQTTQGIIRYTRLLTLDNSQTGNASDYILFTTTPGDQARTPLSTTTLLINSSSGGAASLAFGAGEDNNNYIISGLSGASVGQALAPLNVYATGLITSSITVSSINGITPLSGPETSTLQGQVRELRSSLGMI